jgi:hypothetical protein
MKKAASLRAELPCVGGLQEKHGPSAHDFDSRTNFQEVRTGGRLMASLVMGRMASVGKYLPGHAVLVAAR